MPRVDHPRDMAHYTAIWLLHPYEYVGQVYSLIIIIISVDDPVPVHSSADDGTQFNDFVIGQ